MGLFSLNDETNKEDDGELESNSLKVRQSLAELYCEDAIIDDKKEFDRVRKSMMNVLRAKYSDDVANRALSRVNKRIQKTI